MKKSGNKKLIIILSILVGLIVLMQVLSRLEPSVRNMNMISYTESFSQSETDYIVYFWDESCTFCQGIEPDVWYHHELGVPIYVVDVANSRNSNVWFTGLPGMSNQRPTTPDEIEIEGTPSMMRVVNGQVVDFVAGSDSSVNLMQRVLDESVERVEDGEVCTGEDEFEEGCS